MTTTTVLRNPKALVALACLLFLLQVAPLFSFRWVEDESFYSSAGYTLLSTGELRTSFVAPNHPQSYDSRPLAMPATLAGAFSAFGMNPISARFPELLACLAAVPLVFWLGALLGSREAGAAAALMLSADNAMFLAARTVRPEAFVTFFGLLAVALFVFAKERKSVRLALGAGLAVGASFNYHVNGFAIAASLGLLLLGEYGLAVVARKRAWAVVLASAVTLVPFVLWLTSNPDHLAAFRDLYSRGGDAKFPLSELLHYEAIRYRDWLGIGNQRLSFIRYPIPLRIHIVGLIVFSLAVLARKQRRLFWILTALIVPSLLFWAKEKNATARFFVILAPYFALAIGMAFVALESSRWRRIFAAWCVLSFATQAAANGVILWQSRRADFAAVTSRLRALIPPGGRVFGTVTFYMSFYDRPYYASNYSDFDYSVGKLGVNYLILNDRVMLHGSGYGDDEMREVRERSAEFVKTRAEWIGHVPDPFYGDLQVYRVK